MKTKVSKELSAAASLMNKTIKKAGGSDAILSALKKGRNVAVVAEAVGSTSRFDVAEAVMALSEAQQMDSTVFAEAIQPGMQFAEAMQPGQLLAIAEAVEAAGGPFAIAETLHSAGGGVAEAIDQAGGIFVVAEALAVPGRTVLGRVLDL